MNLKSIIALLLLCLSFFSCTENTLPSPTFTWVLTQGTKAAVSESGSATIQTGTNSVSLVGAGSPALTVFVKATSSGTFKLGNPSTGNYAVINLGGINYSTDSVHTGSITFTAYNTQNTNDYSGSFSFKATDSISVTTGVFTNCSTGN